jgi:hypothetical protein
MDLNTLALQFQKFFYHGNVFRMDFVIRAEPEIKKIAHEIKMIDPSLNPVDKMEELPITQIVAPSQMGIR